MAEETDRAAGGPRATQVPGDGSQESVEATASHGETFELVSPTGTTHTFDDLLDACAAMRRKREAFSQVRNSQGIVMATIAPFGYGCEALQLAYRQSLSAGLRKTPDKEKGAWSDCPLGGKHSWEWGGSFTQCRHCRVYGFKLNNGEHRAFRCCMCRRAAGMVRQTVGERVRFYCSGCVPSKAEADC